MKATTMSRCLLGLGALATWGGCGAGSAGVDPDDTPAAQPSPEPGAGGAGGIVGGAGGGSAAKADAATTDTGKANAAMPDTGGASSGSQQPGVWKNVTPSGIDLMKSWGGMHTILADPVRRGEVYINCDQQGTWKSTDYGLTWTKTNTGVNGDKVNTGRQWSAAIDRNPMRDPTTPPTLIVTQGYGALALWKSTDGGVNWTNIWKNIFAPDGVTSISSDVGADVAGVSMLDEKDPNHLLAYLHSYYGKGGNNGVFESTDGGGKWIVRKSQTFNFQPHADVLFGFDKVTWFVIHSPGYPRLDLHRTTDGGVTWTNLGPSPGSSLKRIGSTLYAKGSGAVFKSTDKGVSWTKIPAGAGVSEIYTVFASSTHLYLTGGRAGGDRNFKIRRAPLDKEGEWTDLPIPTDLYWGKGNNVDAGNAVPGWGVALFDGSREIVLTSNWLGGAWRYVIP